MLKQLLSHINRLPIAVLGTLLLGNVLLAVVLYHQLSGMADANQSTMGKSLVYQLAYSVKTPMLHQDPLSLQVAVGEIAKQPGIARVSVYDSANHLLVEKAGTETKVTAPVQYRAPVMIEGEAAGYAQVELLRQYYRQQSMTIFYVVLVLLAFTTFAAAAVSRWLHRQSVQRIEVLLERLPKVDAAESGGDELTLLEQRLAPLLIVRQPAGELPKSGQQYVTLMALKLRNFMRLKEQLSGSHVSELLLDLDNLLKSVLKLYSGKLVMFFNDLLVLQFVGEEPDDDYPVRALYCAFALIKQLEKWQADKGLDIELSTVLNTDVLPTSDCDLMAQCLVEEQLRQLERLQEKANSGDILLDKATGGHPALDHVALLEPISADLEIFRCEGLEATADTLVVRQLAMLSAVGLAPSPAGT